MVRIASVNDAGPGRTYDKFIFHTLELLLNSRCVLQQVVRKRHIDASGRKTATWKQLDSLVDKSSILQLTKLQITFTYCTSNAPRLIRIPLDRWAPGNAAEKAWFLGHDQSIPPCGALLLVGLHQT